MATPAKLRLEIKKLKASIKSKATPKTIVTKLKSLLEHKEVELEKVTKKVATASVTKSKTFAVAKKYRLKQAGVSASKSDIEKDAVRPAKPIGVRVTDGKHYPYVKGNKYYEYRENRTDRKQPPKKYPKLEDGGYMADGGEIEDKFKGKNSKEIWNNLDSSTKAKVLEHLFIKDNTSGVQYYDSYNSLNELSYSEWDKLPKNIKNEIDNFGQKDKMADGGYMAKGGKVDETKFRVRELTLPYKGNKDAEWVEVTYYGDGFQYSRGVAIDLVGSKEKAIKLAKEQILEDSKKGKLEDGGMMADGGSLEEQNNEMLQSRIKMIKHHADELHETVTDKTHVDAWVVAKIERAASDLSDVAHYLDGLKMTHGGKVHIHTHEHEHRIKH
jgi:hypothetical protein